MEATIDRARILDLLATGQTMCISESIADRIGLSLHFAADPEEDYGLKGAVLSAIVFKWPGADEYRTELIRLSTTYGWS